MAWRPLPGDDHRLPRPLGDSIARVLRHLGAPAPGALETVFGEWERLVGARIAAHAEPVAVHDGVLTVRATDAAWANQLRWLERDVLERIQAVVGEDVIRAIEVRSGPANRTGGRRSWRPKGR